jgi:acetoin utilization deacetylase AcuC-like enzyme
LDARYTAHQTGRGHPERPERIAVLHEHVREQPGLRRVEPRAASEDDLVLVHDERYLVEVARTRELARYAFDADTPVSPQSYDTARLAAGGLLALLDEIMAGRLANGFAFVRPPGHHAERGRAMGFCLFNNVAVGAAYLRRRYHLERVLVVDWDVHHGNGTQHMFEGDPRVLYISTHQYPYYPGTGWLDEVGTGEGEGFTVNLPLPAGFGDAEYLEAFRTVIEPIALQYRPQFVLVSAGFDPHVRDPLAGMAVTEAGFAAMARALLGVAAATAEGRCVAVLEGGYDLRAIRDSAAVVLDELRGGATAPPLPAAPSQAGPLLERVRQVQAQYWKFD